MRHREISILLSSKWLFQNQKLNLKIVVLTVIFQIPQYRIIHKYRTISQYRTDLIGMIKNKEAY